MNDGDSFHFYEILENGTKSIVLKSRPELPGNSGPKINRYSENIYETSIYFNHSVK